MKVIGLTGSIGMGKSTAAAMLRRKGFAVFDADATVHRLQAQGGAALPRIEARFPGTTSAAGLDRARLGAAVFGNAAALRALEAIIHPLVERERRDFLARARRARARAVVLDVPLLFEKGGHRRCDFILVVSAPAHVQRSRVLQRPGMTPEKFAAILATQMPDSRKRRLASLVLPTGLGRQFTRARLTRGLHRLLPTIALESRPDGR
jgi:dephospho-CoA kinase